MASCSILLATLVGAEYQATADHEETVSCFGPETVDPSCQAEVGDYINAEYCNGGICEVTPCPPGYYCTQYSSELPPWVVTSADAVRYATEHNVRYAESDSDINATYSDEDFTASSIPIAPGGHSGTTIGADLNVIAGDPAVSMAAPEAWEPSIGVADPVHPDTALDCDFSVSERTLACLSPQGVFPTSQSDGFTFDEQPRQSEAHGGEVLDPVSLVDGEFVVRGTDLVFPGFGVPYRHARVYRSRVDYDGPLGYGWDHALNQRLIANDGGIVYSTGDARSMRFHPSGRRATSWPGRLAPLPSTQEQWYETETDPGLRLRVRHNLLRPTWTMTEPGGLVSTFNSSGLLVSVVDANGNGLAIEWAQYDKDPSTEEDLVWRTAKVIDSVGRQIDYQYDSRARLTTVVEPRSGFRATYTYDAQGDLRTATDSRHRTETFDYSSGFDDTADTYVPELALRRGCELACAQTGSNAAAGGACDDAAEDGPGLCTSGCKEQCSASCFLGCFGACGDGCAEACSCESRCAQFAEATCYESWWNDDFWWMAYGCVPHKPYQHLGPAPGTCVYDCAAWATNKAINHGVYDYRSAAWFSDVGYCALRCISPFSNPCWKQYEAKWKEVCLQDFNSLCMTGAVPWRNGRSGEEHCEDDDNPSCVADCAIFGTPDVDACLPACKSACTAECEPGCGRCLTDELDFVAGCERGCGDACLETGRDGEPPRYGHIRDLNHNIVRLIDGNGDVFVTNSYGEELGQPSFDAVISQQIGEATAQIVYRDLEVEYAQQPEPAPPVSGEHVPTPIVDRPGRDLGAYGGLGAFASVDVCPTGECTFDGASMTADTFVPWGPTLVVFDGESPGLRYRVTKTDGTTAPVGISILLLRIERGRAIVVPRPSTRGFRFVTRAVSAVQDVATTAIDQLVAVRRLSFANPMTPIDVVKDVWRGVPDFELHADGDIARFWREVNGDYYYEGGGAWSAEGEITLIRENSGVIRAYPGRPSALLHVADGQCARAFSAHLGSNGALRGGMAQSCSDSLTVSPLASLVADSGVIAAFRSGLSDSDASAQAVLEPRDLFGATPLTPKRVAVVWQRGEPRGLPIPVPDVSEYPSDSDGGTPPGTDAYIGWPAAGSGAAPFSHYRGASTAVAKANLWARPHRDFDVGDRPLYAFHWPRIDDGSALVWYDNVAVDTPAEFDAVVSAPGCSGRSSTEASAPTRSTVVRDVYGEIWVYHWDRRGRLLQKKNYGTEATTRFDYNARGALVGLWEPLGHRSCLVHDAEGALVRAVRYGQPGVDEPLAPIVQRYAYTNAVPRRLRYVFDPLDPSRVLAEYQWDANGNLVGVVDALGNTTILEPSPWGITAQETDPSGVVTRYIIDADVGVVESIVRDASGPQPAVTAVQHDSAGRPVLATTPLGLRTIWEWDVTGTQRLQSVRYEDGEGLQRYVVFGYDDDGQVTSTTDGESQTTIRYDVTGSPRCSRTVSLDGSAPEIRRGTYHGPDGRLLAIVEPKGQQYQAIYDGEGRPTSTRLGGTYVDPCAAPRPPLVGPTAAQLAMSSLWEVDYDVAGRPVVRRDGRGILTELRYDAHGRLADTRAGIDSTGDPAVVRRSTFNARGQLIWSDIYEGAFADARPSTGWTGESSVAVPAGLLAASAFVYDPVGRVRAQRARHFDDTGTLLGVDGSGVSLVEFEYDDLNRRITTRVPTGAASELVTEVSFDGHRRQVNTLLPTGDTIDVSYRDGGRMVRRAWDATVPGGRQSMETRFTAWGAVANIATDDAGSRWELGSVFYDVYGRPERRISASGATTSTEYDALGRPRIVSRWIDDNAEAAEVVTMVWDREGRLTDHISDVARGAGRHAATTRFQYDVLGRLEATTRPDGTVEKRGYEANTMLPAFFIDGREVTIVFEHDPLGNMSGQWATSNEGGVAAQRSYTYDGLGRLRMAHTEGLVSDGFDDVTTHFAWDSLGNPLGEWHSALGESLGVRHSPDALGRPVASTLAGRAVSRSFDGAGRLIDLRLGSDLAAHYEYSGLGGPVSRALSSGVATQYDYDALGRLRGINDDRGGSELAGWNYEIGIDGVPRVAQLTRLGAAQSSLFSVDRSGRLLAENHDLTTGPGPLASDSDWAAANALVAPYLDSGFAWRSYELDGRANWFERDGGEPDLFVQPDIDDVDAYVDFGGIVASYDDGGALVDYGDETYETDLFGQLVWVSSASAGHAYTYDALGRIVRDEDSETGTVTLYGYDSASRAVRRRGDAVDVTLDNGLDEHVVTIRGDGTRHFYHTDRMGSVYLVTNDSGDPLEWYGYTAYGETTIYAPDLSVLPDSAIGNRFGFQGQPFDTSTGLIEMRARFYKPAWGRFVTRDPIGLGGGTNLYAFVNGAPLSFTDPFGLSAKNANRSNIVCVGQAACDLLDAKGRDAFSKYDWAGAPYDLPVPELVGSSLHFEKGFIYSAYEHALDAASDPNNSALQRLLSFLLAGLSSPLAWGEEYIGRTSLNIPYTIYSGADSAGQNAARGSLHLDRGQPLDATADFLHVVRDGSASFDAAGGVLSPFSKIRGHTGIPPAAGSATRGAGRRLPFKDGGRVKEINKTLDRIDSNGPFPHRRDGTVFRNREGRLPEGSYREYTVDTPGATNRGARRIVRDQDTGRTFYTDDHYGSFVEIDPTKY